MKETDYTIPFDPADFGVVPMFVWCPTRELAEEFLHEYNEKEFDQWITRWADYGGDCIYAVPGAEGTGYGHWMFGRRHNYDSHYRSKGYVSRVYRGSANFVEVGDLL